MLGWLHTHLDHEENALSEVEIEHHLKNCRECLERVEFERRLRARLAETGSTDVPEAVRAHLNALIGEFWTWACSGGSRGAPPGGG